jgi:tetratricopeptide (TPR) repeat protein
MEGGNLPEAERLIHRALELNPNLADAYLVLGRVQSALGRMDEALAAFQRAAELNPLAPRILDNQACQLDWAGRYEEGWAVIERATALQPDSVQIQCYRARLLTSLGRRDEALQQARELEHNSTDPTEWNFRALTAAEVYARFGHLAEAEALAARLAPGVSEKVISYGCIRRPEAALPLLGQLNFFWLDDLIWNPDFDAVRQDPRYRAYLEKAGLVEANARAQAWRKAHPAAKS